jgi:hypothetical protein
MTMVFVSELSHIRRERERGREGERGGEKAREVSGQYLGLDSLKDRHDCYFQRQS